MKMRKNWCSLLLCVFVLPLAADSENYRKLFQEGESLRNARKYAEAQEVFRKAFAEPGITADQKCLSLMRSAQCDFWRGKYAEAVPVMKEAVGIPGVTAYYKSDSFLWLANTYSAQKKWDEALEAAGQAFGSAPATLPGMKVSALLISGNAFRMKKDFRKAADSYRQAVLLEKVPPEMKNKARKELVQSYYEAGEYPQAVETAQEILNAAESTAAERKKAQKWIADSFFAAQNFEQAARELEKYKAMPEGK